MSCRTAFALDYIGAFNDAVSSGDFADLLGWYDDDAVVRFENVPPGGIDLEFAGRPAVTAAYAGQPPDDQIDVTASPREEDSVVVVGFAWRRDGAPGLLRLAITDDRAISSLVVKFG